MLPLNTIMWWLTGDILNLSLTLVWSWSSGTIAFVCVEHQKYDSLDQESENLSGASDTAVFQSPTDPAKNLR